LITEPDPFGTVSTPGVRQTQVPARNVVGLVRGSDPVLRDEYLVLMAQYAHDVAVAQPRTGLRLVSMLAAISSSRRRLPTA
jgi:hypothetical protein